MYFPFLNLKLHDIYISKIISPYNLRTWTRYSISVYKYDKTMEGLYLYIE